MTDDLDILLSAPLPDVADSRFSERVMRRIVWEQRIYVVFLSVLAFACVLLALSLPQMRALSAEAARAIPEYAGSLAVKAMAAILIITYLLDRQISRSDAA